MKITKEKLISSLNHLEKAFDFFENSLREEEHMQSLCLICDPNFPSLFLWSQYQMYQNNIICDSILEDKEELDELAKIYTILKLDSFYIDAKDSAEKSINRLSCYIKEVRDNLNEMSLVEIKGR